MLNLLNIQYPIIQAPMANIVTLELIAAVSNQGALGSLAGGYMSTVDMIKTIQTIHYLTSKPFLVNLFIYPPWKLDQNKIALSKKLLVPYCQELHIRERINESIK